LRGDSAESGKIEKLKDFIEKLEAIKRAEMSCSIILDDPCGNSYVQNLVAPKEDPRLRVTQYERSFEQNEELGINDMKVEGYGEEDIQEPQEGGAKKAKDGVKML